MSQSSLLSLCREEYARLARELTHQGLSRQSVEECRDRLVEERDGRWYVKPLAYRPTGVALGCPLPDHGVLNTFYRAACSVERWMQSVGDPSAPGFAHVPPDAYHITLLNRSHYDVNEVVSMTPEEGQVVEASLRRLAAGPIRVLATGLQLTRTGRVFARCLPTNDKILELRSQLASLHPELRTNIPRVVHIKLGHLLKPLEREELARFCLWMNRLGNSTIAQMDFTDVYTPLGRIPL
jgi:hypothetical protein